MSFSSLEGKKDILTACATHRHTARLLLTLPSSAAAKAAMDWQRCSGGGGVENMSLLKCIGAVVIVHREGSMRPWWRHRAAMAARSEIIPLQSWVYGSFF